MTRKLDVLGGRPRILSPTTTTKLAHRMLVSSQAITEALPVGFYASPALDILLTLHSAEESAHYPRAGDISPPGSISPAVTERWTKALVDLGLVEQHGDLLALSDKGHETVIKLLEAVFSVQRTLD